MWFQTLLLLFSMISFNAPWVHPSFLPLFLTSRIDFPFPIEFLPSFPSPFSFYLPLSLPSPLLSPLPPPFPSLCPPLPSPSIHLFSFHPFIFLHPFIFFHPFIFLQIAPPPPSPLPTLNKTYMIKRCLTDGIIFNLELIQMIFNQFKHFESLIAPDGT